MNRVTWGTVREYIDAEIKLALARRDAVDPHVSLTKRIQTRDETIPALEAQSTRMETAIRESLPER